MIALRTKKATPDRSKIALEHPEEARHWAKHFDVSEEICGRQSRRLETPQQPYEKNCAASRGCHLTIVSTAHRIGLPPVTAIVAPET